MSVGQEPPGGWNRPLASSTAGERAADGVKHPLGRAWGFTILSFGLWGYYWFYVTRRRLDRDLAHDRRDATLHTLGLLVPVLNVFIVYWLWRDLGAARTRAGLPGFPHLAYLIGSLFLPPVFYSLVLGRANEYWDARAGGEAGYAPVTTVEKVLIGMGIALWLAFLLIVVIGLLIAAVWD